MNEIKHDDIDLFKLFRALRNGRWIISTFVIIAIICGSGLILIKTPVYHSVIKLSIDTKPVLYDLYDVSVDFNRMFYSKNIFDKWKKENNSSLNFKDFSKRTIIDGFVLTDSRPKIAKLVLRKKVSSYISLKTDNLSQLDEFYNYANYISDALIPKYILKIEKELTRVEKRYKGKTAFNIHIIERLLSYDRYISKVNEGEKVFAVEPPTIPEKIEPKALRILGISALLGLIIGIFYVFMRITYYSKK